MDLSSNTIAVVRNIGYRHPFAIKLVAYWGTGATSSSADNGIAHESDSAPMRFDGTSRHDAITQESTAAHAKGKHRALADDIIPRRPMESSITADGFTPWRIDFHNGSLGLIFIALKTKISIN